MILRNQVEWALHCCAILSAVPEGVNLSIKTLSEFHGVPKEYLAKAMQNLSRAGIVKTSSGPTGGYRLAKKTGEITFLDVVEAIEGRRSTFQCSEIRANNPCYPKKQCDRRPCSIARIMWQADEAWRSKLRSVSLADLGQMLEQEIDPDILAKSFEWLLAR